MSFSNPIRLQYYNIYYPSGCDTEIGDHLCNDCEDAEHARVRSIAFVKKTKVFADISNPVEWQAAIAAKDVIVIPKVRGTFDGGSETEGPGYGDQETKLLGYNFVLTYQDPNYKQNASFYNALKRSSNYYLVYRTETQVHSSDVAVQVIPKNPVTEPTTDEVTWAVTVKWSNSDVPTPHDEPAGIFSQCFDYV